MKIIILIELIVKIKIIQNIMNTSFQRNGQAMLGKKTNCLLVKDDVGKAKPFTRKLPKEDFCFGKGSKFSESAADGKY